MRQTDRQADRQTDRQGERESQWWMGGRFSLKHSGDDEMSLVANYIVSHWISWGWKKWCCYFCIDMAVAVITSIPLRSRDMEYSSGITQLSTLLITTLINQVKRWGAVLEL